MRHYGCSDVQAALRHDRIGLSDNWAAARSGVRQKHELRLKMTSEADAAARLRELNVIEQVSLPDDDREMLGTVVSPSLCTDGIYGIQDGLLRELSVTITEPEEGPEIYRTTMAAYG